MTEHTGPDSIRCYYTGAAAHGNAQTDPAASLGGNLSSTQHKPLGWQLESVALTGVSIAFVSGNCGPGLAKLRGDGAGTVQFAAPGEDYGRAVDVSGGGTVIIQSATPSKYIRLSWSGDTAASGVMTLRLVHRLGEVIGPRNATSGEAAAGSTIYRAVGLQSTPSLHAIRAWLMTLAGPLTLDQDTYGLGACEIGVSSGDFQDWPQSGCVLNETTSEVIYYASRSNSRLVVAAGGRDLWNDTVPGSGVGERGTAGDSLVCVPPLRIGWESPGAQPAGSIQTIVNETTAPVGVTFTHPVDWAGGAALGAQAAGYWQGLWIERKLSAGTYASPLSISAVSWGFLSFGT